MNFYNFIILLLFSPFILNAQKTDMKNYLSFPTPAALHKYFKYRVDAKPIIQGHRGTMENGLPENSIAAFDYVLEHTESIFEIDPRLTKDSIIVVFHDETLERTTNGKGKLSDYTWEELQQLNLKDSDGNLTKYKVPSLAEVLEWARGKTALILDKKDVPVQMTANIIQKLNAVSYTIPLVRSTEDAQFYYEDNNEIMLSISLRSAQAFQNYLNLGIPPSQMFIAAGTTIKYKRQKLYNLLNKYKVRYLIATASSYDKLKTKNKRAEAYRAIIKDGASMIESNYPIEVANALTQMPE